MEESKIENIERELLARTEKLDKLIKENNVKEKSRKKDAILTPIYNENNYKYHLCSNCNKEIYIKEDIWQPMYFKEQISYCPYCGNNIIRYGKPKFEEEPNFDWLEIFSNILDKAETLIKYELFCKMTNAERKEIIEKARFGIEYFGRDLCWNDNKNTCEIVKEVASKNIHYSEIKKINEKCKELGWL